MPTGPLIAISPLGLAIYGLLIISSFFTLYRYGGGKVFAYIYLPMVLFLFNIPLKSIPVLPALTTSSCIGYGVLMGLALRPSELKKIRWNIIDTFMVVMLIPVFLASSGSDGPWRGIRDTGDAFFVWFLPYLLARLALQDADARKVALKVLCVSAIIIAGITAYEARMLPNFTSRFLMQRGLSRIIGQMVLPRFGLFRATATMAQPIDLGNCGVLMGGMIIALTPTVGKKWFQPLPLAGVICSGAIVVGSISITAWGATAVCFVLYFVFSRRIGYWAVAPVVLVLLLGLTEYTHHVLDHPPPDDRPADAVEASAWIRKKIIVDSWQNCSTAGLTGYGNALDTTHIGVGSVDNSYLLFLMSQGWLALIMWVLFAFMLAFKAAAALRRTQTSSERLPVAAITATIIAILFGMYTVFFGFLYATLFCVVIGMLSTMTQMLASQRRGLPGTVQQVLPMGAAAGGYR